MSASPVRSAAIGLRARTGHAIAIVLAGNAASPQAVARAEIVLAAATTPSLYQPYHEVMDLPWERAVTSVRKAERALEAAAVKGLTALVSELQSRALDATAVGIVGAPERNLAAIGSPHIRAHAAEGVLFRRVLQVGAAASELACTAFPERDFESFAASRLGLSVAAVRARLAEFGQGIGRPWRADEKAAAMAAWIVLAA